VFAAFVESLPDDSYLRPMMEGIQNELNANIDNDFGFVEYGARMRYMQADMMRAKELEAKVTALQGEIRQLEKNRGRIEVAISDMRSTARTILNAK